MLGGPVRWFRSRYGEARLLLVVLGGLLLWLSWDARVETERYARTLALMGGVSVLAGLILARVVDVVTELLPRLIGGRLGPLEFTFSERAAAAATAEISTTPGDIAAAIGSTDAALPGPTPQDPEIIGILNFNAGDIALRGIFDWTTEPGQPLEHCEIRLYLYDEEARRLKPVMAPKEAAAATAWEPGKGATGTAWKSKEYVVASGAAASDGTYGLTRRQQQQYRNLTCVASAPVFNSRQTIIGVLTATTTDPNQRLDTDEGKRDLVLASLLVSRVLIELLQWFSDDE